MSTSNRILMEESLAQRRKGATRYRVTNGLSLRRCAFAREIFSRSRALVVLAKPEITFMVMISAGLASVLASGSLRMIAVVHTVLGIGLFAAGGSSTNQ